MSEDAKKLIEEAKARWKLCVDSESDTRREWLEDMNMALGNQWPNTVSKERIDGNRPSLTINRLPQFICQVTNDMRQNETVPKAVPVGDGASKETSNIINGLIRHIVSASDASVAFDTAVKHQVTGGFGYYRLVTDYCDEKSFDQDIKIKRVKNPMNVYLDVNHTEPDASDAMYGFVVEDIEKDAYEDMYPKSKLAGMNDFTAIGDDPWIQGDTVRLVEYFKVVESERDLYLLTDGTTTFIAPEDEAMIKNTRKATTRKVMWYKLSAMDILEETVFPGKYIPIIPVLGDEEIVEGKRYLVGLVRNARDAQRMLNYWVSAQTETIALAPKAPFIMAEGQDEGYSQFWDNANTKAYSRLVYKPVTINGQLAPPPQRQVAEPPVQAMAQATNMAAQFLKDTTGIYDASLGSHGNETSGKAILARQKQGDISNFHFVSNFARSQRHLGRVLLSMIPEVYDAPRVITIVYPDQKNEQVSINQQTQHEGMDAIFDLTAGRYDVVMESGPSYNTKREQQADSMMQISQAYPQLWQIAGDLMVGAMDWPNAEKLAERLKFALPPQIQQAEKADQAKIPPQVQQQLAQMQQMVEQMTQELQQSASEIDELKRGEAIKKMEIDSRERIATMNAQVEMLKTQANLEHGGQLKAFEKEFEFLKQRFEQLHEKEMQPAAEPPETNEPNEQETA